MSDKPDEAKPERRAWATTTLMCAHCGRPMTGATVIHHGAGYHLECTRGPSWRPEPELSREDVRRIVMDELRRLGINIPSRY